MLLYGALCPRDTCILRGRLLNAKGGSVVVNFAPNTSERVPLQGAGSERKVREKN